MTTSPPQEPGAGRGAFGHYPDSPHHIGQAQWPSVVLNPGQTFSSTVIYQFAVTGNS
jgi:galactose mutarotase-like enzyme